MTRPDLTRPDLTRPDLTRPDLTRPDLTRRRVAGRALPSGFGRWGGHVAPLEHRGLAQVRRVCREGLEAGTGEVTWQVPDLTVVTAGDLAVAWGLNRVRADGPDGQPIETWSRGTRVFRRTGAAWSMVHQHLSYPVDPRTGAVRTDLRP